MGKHERDLIKEAELIIVKILNGQSIIDSDRKNPWFDHAIKIASHIKSDYYNIEKAIHLGDTYENAGDILLKIIDGHDIIVEVKMSESKSGLGTKANLGQNSLTELGLFNSGVTSWSHFRDSLGHTKWVNKYLDLYKNYPDNIYQIKNINGAIEGKARYLRDNKILEILFKISDRDRKEKIKYLQYLSVNQQNEENIKKFYILLMLGIHKGSIISELMSHNDLISELENLIVYYSNVRDSNITVTKEDVGVRVRSLVTHSIFKIIFPKNVTHCLIVRKKKDGKIEKLLAIAFHWKNVSQGIQTPCLNIFDQHN